MTEQEKRFCRRELINYYLISKPYPLNKKYNPFFLHDLTFLVRNSEIYRYGYELKYKG